MNVPTKLLFLSAAVVLASACNPILRTHGYVPTAEKPQEVNPETDTKTSVLSRLGNPSIRSTFDEELEEEAAALKAYEVNKVKRLYQGPVAVIPYPTKSKKVTRYGFERLDLSLP